MSKNEGPLKEWTITLNASVKAEDRDSAQRKADYLKKAVEERGAVVDPEAFFVHEMSRPSPLSHTYTETTRYVGIVTIERATRAQMQSYQLVGVYYATTYTEPLKASPVAMWLVDGDEGISQLRHYYENTHGTEIHLDSFSFTHVIEKA